MNVAEGSVLEMELRPSICSRRLLYSASFSPCLSNSLNILFFPLCAAFSSFVFASGAEPSASLNSLEISHNVWGGKLQGGNIGRLVLCHLLVDLLE